MGRIIAELVRSRNCLLTVSVEGCKTRLMFRVLPYDEARWPEIWKILHPVFQGGETYAFPTDINEAQAHTVWVEDTQACFMVLGTDNAVAGTFYIKPNPSKDGMRVCNAGYVVSDVFRGQGIASMMCAFSQNEGAALGFQAMQFNCVAATNIGAVQLWQKLGFEIIETKIDAFNHAKQGLVDAYVMYKKLEAE